MDSSLSMRDTIFAASSIDGTSCLIMYLSPPTIKAQQERMAATKPAHSAGLNADQMPYR
jgi:hypothetical protein